MIQREAKVINGKQYLCCNKCGEFKEASTDNRPKNKRGQLGLGTWCKKCMSEYAKNNKEKYQKYYWENREYCNERNKEYNEKHKEEISKQRKKHYQENKELFAERNKNRYEKNKDVILQKQSQYYYRTREDRLETSRKYRENNAEKIKDRRIANRWKVAESRKNNGHYKEYQKQYDKEHRAEINERKKRRRKETGYGAIHLKTARAIKKLGIRPSICPICGEEARVEAHHPNYEKRNEIIFACNKCHQRIHNGWIECPKDVINIQQ